MTPTLCLSNLRHIVQRGVIERLWWTRRVHKVTQHAELERFLIARIAARPIISAVQHERGPRKPKLQPSSNPQMQPSPVGHGLQQHMPVGDNKLPTSSSSLHFPPGLFGPPRPLKALTLPPPPVPSPTSHIDALPPSMFHPPALPPPPGLLHILMSAEKCQVSYKVCEVIC
ncbi:hypothetical protein GEV33_002765 [Tenebrio molitor]|jgi:hypothetical protein|uniref:Uncharacterized protein n=1 Tax=Tenebrio molitor TaxID=7067 RepID=A0A8J6LP46_TENMO|nr:hypothetical protein GEV33_002765 [Tenebrio molitor]